MDYYGLLLTSLGGESANGLDNTIGPYITRQIEEDASCSQTGGDSNVYLDGAVVFVYEVCSCVVQTHSLKGVEVFCPGRRQCWKRGGDR